MSYILFFFPFYLKKKRERKEKNIITSICLYYIMLYDYPTSPTRWPRQQDTISNSWETVTMGWQYIMLFTILNSIKINMVNKKQQQPNNIFLYSVCMMNWQVVCIFMMCLFCNYLYLVSWQLTSALIFVLFVPFIVFPLFLLWFGYLKGSFNNVKFWDTRSYM